MTEARPLRIFLCHAGQQGKKRKFTRWSDKKGISLTKRKEYYSIQEVLR